MKTRLYFLDNLRTVLILLVVVLHTGIVYEPILENTWIVSDPDKNSSLGLLRMYLDIFVMFIIFYISGYLAPASLNSKGPRNFILSKVKRIMIPWLVAVFTLIPAYKVIFLYSRGLAQEAWYTYFHLYQRVGGDPGSFADNPVQNWLWFLPVLFTFQMAYLALSKLRVLNLKISLKTAVGLTFVVGLAYSMLISRLNLMGWHHSPLFHFQRERLVIYFLSFLLGSLCYKLNVFGSDRKNKKLYIVSNVVLTLSLGIFTAVALNLFFNMIDPGRNYYFVSPFVDRLAYHSTLLLSMLSFLHIFLYGFRYSLNKTNRLMSVLNQSSYGVYIIHVVVLGLVATLLLNTQLPVLIKFLASLTLTYLVSNLLVYTYFRFIRKKLPRRSLQFAIPVAAVLVSLLVYQAKDREASRVVPATAETPVVQAPEIGLHMAAIEGKTEIIQQHILAGTELNEPDPAGGSSPLILAALFGQEEAARYLVEAGADVNFKNNDGSTALHTAAFFCRPVIVQTLLEYGADTSATNNSGSTPLESVSGPFAEVKGIYDYFANTLGPMGLELNYPYLEETRPVVAEMIRNTKTD